MLTVDKKKKREIMVNSTYQHVCTVYTELLSQKKKIMTFKRYQYTY